MRREENSKWLGVLVGAALAVVFLIISIFLPQLKPQKLFAGIIMLLSLRELLKEAEEEEETKKIVTKGFWRIAIRSFLLLVSFLMLIGEL